jgi:hypothetical protein
MTGEDKKAANPPQGILTSRLGNRQSAIANLFNFPAGCNKVKNQPITIAEGYL